MVTSLLRILTGKVLESQLNLRDLGFVEVENILFWSYVLSAPDERCVSDPAWETFRQRDQGTVERRLETTSIINPGVGVPSLSGVRKAGD
jgi:hypothetical protein